MNMSDYKRMVLDKVAFKRLVRNGEYRIELIEHEDPRELSSYKVWVYGNRTYECRFIGDWLDIRVDDDSIDLAYVEWKSGYLMLLHMVKLEIDKYEAK